MTTYNRKTFGSRWKKLSKKIQKCFHANLLHRCVRLAWYSSQNVYNSPVDNRAEICYNIGKVESTNALFNKDKENISAIEKEIKAAAYDGKRCVHISSKFLMII